MADLQPLAQLDRLDFDGTDALRVTADALPLPDGAAQDATLQAILGVQDEVKGLADAMLYFATAILEKLPRLDATDRAAVTVETTVPSVATVVNMTNLNNLAGGNTALIPTHMGNIGALHLYNQITVSP